MSKVWIHKFDVTNCSGQFFTENPNQNSDSYVAFIPHSEAKQKYDIAKRMIFRAMRTLEYYAKMGIPLNVEALECVKDLEKMTDEFPENQP